MMKLATVTAAVWAAIAGLSFATAANAAAIHFNLHIPREPLDAALRDLAHQTGVQVGRFSDQARSGLLVGPVQGSLSADDALKVLLQSTGLSYRALSDRAYIVATASALAASAGGSMRNPWDRPRQGSAAVRESPNAGVSKPSAGKEGKSDSFDRFRLAQASPGTPTDDASIERGRGGPADQQAPGLQEIVVTAEKVKERLIDVPISMSVLSAREIEKLGATQFTDFATAVPGLDFSTAGSGFTQISMRGVTTGYDVSSTVGIYLDDVPVGSSSIFALGNLFALDPELFDVSSVEILRGPQGTLYGASAMGGLIRYVTPMPALASFRTEARVSASEIAGGGTGYQAASAVNLPVVPGEAAVRLSAYERHDGGYIKNIALSKGNVDQGDTYGGRVNMLWQPFERLSVELSAFLQDTSRGGEATADYSADGSMPYGSLGQYRPFPGGEPFTERFRLLSVKLTYDFGPAVLTAISGYQELTESNVWDVSSGFAPLCALLETFSCGSLAAQSSLGMHKFTQEVRVASKQNRTLEWLAGAFYTRETASQYEYFMLRSPTEQPEPNDLFTYYLPSRYEEDALFGDLTWHVIYDLDLTGGVRYARDYQRFTQAGSGLLGASKPTTSSTEDVRNYLATLRYHFTANATGYLRYATGYRPGGPNYVTLNPGTGLPNGPPVSQPDSLKEYEAGAKVESPERRLAADLSIYEIDWRDIQVATNNGGFSSITNAPGGATIDGAELTLSGRPVDRLTASTSMAYTHAYKNAASVALGAVPGERLPGSPRFTTSVSADYELTAAGVRPTLGVTFRYVSDRTVDFDSNRPPNVQARLPSYRTVDLRAGLTIGIVSVQLFLHNVLDERGESSILLPQFGDRVGLIQPRTVGLSVIAGL